jgi:16S rRNA (uracil1498-N3)-methyltransferase
MHHFLVDPAEWPRDERDELALPAEAAHHLLKVLRAGVGDPVGILDGRGRVATARLVEARRGTAVLRVISRSEVPSPSVSVLLAQAVPKGAGMDWIVEKATELGATSIVPLVTERCVVALSGAPAERRVRRWRKIAASAVEQCGAAWMPEVRPVVRLPEFLNEAPRPDAMLVGSLRETARPLREALPEIRAAAPRRVGLVIGPEGDLTREEMAALKDAGGIEVSFGARILRTETAAVYGLSVLAFALAEPGS